MYFAKERRGSEKVVRASDAFPGRYYACPTCFAEVFLRRGRWRVAHFAHRSGHGKPECENYHPSGDLAYSWPGYGTAPTTGGNNFRPADPLILSIELQPESTVRGRKLRAWELRLTVPKSEDARGQIRIDCGTGPKPTVALSKLALAAQTYNVDPDTVDFGAIWVSPEVRPEYKAVVEDRIPGLDREQATLFASSTGRLKPRADRVTWGGNYYLVWHTAHNLAFPRNLAAQPLAPTGSWHCAFITLPDDEDGEIRAWIEESTAVTISPQRRMFGLVYPPPCGLDILGRVNIPVNAPVVVGLRQNEAEHDTTITVRATAGNASPQIALEGTGRHLLLLSQDSGRAQIALRLNEFSLPLLTPTSTSVANVFPTVQFLIRGVAVQGRTETILGSKHSFALLEKVRSTPAEIFECSVPSGVKGALRWKNAKDDLRWSSMPLGSDSSQASFTLGANELVQLNERLKDRRCEVEIDFGAFGLFRAFSDKGITERSATPIPQALRNRIRWLASASAAFNSKQSRYLRHLDDDALLQFVREMRVLAPFAAHHRALLTDLQRLSAGSARR